MPTIHRRLTEDAPILLDAGMGSRLMACGLVLGRDDPCLWNLDHPEVVAAIHRADISAGADALLTNTFSAYPANLERLGRLRDGAEILRRGVKLARAAAGPSRLVFGDLGPFPPEDRISNTIVCARILWESGIDALLLETQTTDSAREMVEGCRLEIGELSVMVSRHHWPDPIAPIVHELEDLGVLALGVNCATGIDETLTELRRLREVTELPLLAKPNGGLPGGPSFGPETFAEAWPALQRLGVRLVGGCCQTTAKHLQALRTAIDDGSAVFQSPSFGD